ncbi:hypothetical protein ETD86_31680 [Nonomuraea turkmeniaca]|uniref:Uncharacterized protein n=1 Tax=Nonomuraea turkmeniaca TaxID=103838 RepID=A0A5S4F8W6_9ACTN|nr:hypothetical protein [Nonomuraea turkmeniaca]TMR12901.1 hypothetical protein ETD86_31680 [Nonomuraea turkmeniaca]
MNAVLGKIADRALGWVIPENAAAAGTVSCTPTSSSGYWSTCRYNANCHSRLWKVYLVCYCPPGGSGCYLRTGGKRCC